MRDGVSSGACVGWQLAEKLTLGLVYLGQSVSGEIRKGGSEYTHQAMGSLDRVGEILELPPS